MALDAILARCFPGAFLLHQRNDADEDIGHRFTARQTKFLRHHLLQMRVRQAVGSAYYSPNASQFLAVSRCQKLRRGYAAISFDFSTYRMLTLWPPRRAVARKQ